ncbi:MAG: hypothetical protein WCL51_03705 [Bacteroidota bacterium]
MYTIQEAFNQSIAIIDELSDTGLIDANKTKEYSAKAPYLADLWQREMVASGGLFKTFEISCMRKKNLISEFDSFIAVEHLTDDQSYQGTGANCFHFSVDGQATVYIEELIGSTWTPVNGFYMTSLVPSTAFSGTINASTPTSSFNDYKGLITPVSQYNPVRIRFSGSYYYRHSNRALCPYKYPVITLVPSFKPYYKVDMPSDFKSKSQVINMFPDWQYIEGTDHKWEGNTELYIQFGYEGTIRVKYVPVPTKITLITQTIEVDDITAASLSYYLAWHFAIADQNDALAAMCKEKFRTLKIESFAKTPMSMTDIKDVYGVS